MQKNILVMLITIHFIPVLKKQEKEWMLLNAKIVFFVGHVIQTHKDNFIDYLEDLHEQTYINDIVRIINDYFLFNIFLVVYFF